MKFPLLLACSIISFFLFGQKPVVVAPMQTFGDHIFIKLSVDGSEPLDFIFDTGDGLTVIDLDVARKLNLPLNNNSAKKSAQGSIIGALIDHNYIEMQGVRLEDDIKVYATSLRHLEMSIGRNIDGIIGYDLLQHYAVELDHLNEKFKLHDGKTYTYKSIGDRYEMGLEKYIPVVTAKVKLANGESFDGTFFVITGAGTTLDFNAPFAKKNSLVDKTGDHYSYLVKGLESVENMHYEGRIQEFQLGKINFNNLPVGISTAKKGVQANRKVQGIIGNRMLKYFTVIFDYKNKAMYMERVAKTVTDFHVNACGFEVQMDTDMTKVLVHRIYERGQADDAGIKVNDELISVNGTPVSELALPKLNALLNQENSTVELVLKRGEEEITVVLELKELI